MSPLGPRRVLLLLVSIALLTIVPITASAQTQADVDAAARRQRIAEAKQTEAYKAYRAASERLEEVRIEYEAIHNEHELLLERMARMEEAVTRYTEQADAIEESARRIVVDAYISGQTQNFGAAFQAATIQDLVTTQALVDRATQVELATLDSLSAVTRQVDRSTTELEAHRVEVATAEDAAAVLVAEMNSIYEEQARILANADAALNDAIADYKREVKEKQIEDDRIKRQQAATASQQPGKAGGAAPAQTPGFICPVQGGASFSDTWGARRSGGRRHKGVDMFNTRNTPLLAVTDGRIKFSSNSIGGRSTHLYADNGVVYYYTHLEAHPTNISSGQRVSKGTVVGFLGNSGNARYTSPHLHFEIRPGGVAVNPYPTVRSAC
ncbi:MAG: peptidoglycan DD-metalloendopeptidase family protein [Acidimicrobiia bacterium]|nr:peptidoglycan DD-metalloendopeptidase family protein [Acidimicrobiia bacterium]